MTGATGPAAGATGLQGTNGLDGNNGRDGAPGVAGPTGPAGPGVLQDPRTHSAAPARAGGHRNHNHHDLGDPDFPACDY